MSQGLSIIELMFVLAHKEDDIVPDIQEKALVMAFTQVITEPWHRLADVIEESGDIFALLDGSYQPADSVGQRIVREIKDRVDSEGIKICERDITRILEAFPDAQLLTVLDDDYPANLRLVYNRPPFIFIRGNIHESDKRAIAVVGTRRASPDGIEQARLLARALVARDVTVVSGLASGIDTAAHASALEAGGRTIAVMGTGIDRVYPRENAKLANEISFHGALVSQFWPGTSPNGTNFPIRNAVTSGMSIGTVVIEASKTSGAKNQARLALEHGKRLFLIESLVMNEEWAQKYATKPGATVVKSVDDVVHILDAELAQPTQLRLV